MWMQRAAFGFLACVILLAAGAGKFSLSAPTARSSMADEDSVRAFLAHVQQSFNSGDLDDFMQVFTEDTVQLAEGIPDTVGRPAVRKGYEQALADNDIKVEFHTQEIKVAGDIAYERGTYTLHINRRADGAHVADVTQRHIHVLRRQADGSWKTWRMMTNLATR
jgi:uncharacterized protein (TIGR02246 family)